MLTFLTIALVVIVLVAMNFLYVASEFASVKARKTRIISLAENGNSTAKTLLPMVEEGKAIDKYVAACQIGITLSSLSLGAYGQRVLAVQLAEPLAQLTTNFGWDTDIVSAATEGTALAIAVWGVLVFITVLQVVVGELIPKSLAIQRPEEWSIRTAYLMKLSIWAYTVLIWFFNGSGNLILRIMGMEHKDGHGHVHSAQEIELLVRESTEAGILDEDEQQMLRNTFRLKELTARQVMVHRTRMISAPEETPVADLLQLSLEHGYTRIPVYKDNIDQITGIVHIKDLFKLHSAGKSTLDKENDIRGIGFVPESLPVPDVWDALRQSGQYLVAVFDEYGGTAGIISLEDLIEEIFGELQDEFDDEVALISEDPQGRVYLRGDLLISDVNEYMDLNLPEDTNNTLGGLIIHATEGSPEVGQEIEIAGIHFRIEKIADLGVDEISFVKPNIEIPTNVEWEVADHE
jgi:CBS domain containing-hemolysin-like protein